MDFTDATGVTINFHHSLFSQCNVSLKSDTITQASDNYHYRSYLDSLMISDTDVAATNLLNAYWYLDTGEMLPSYPSAGNLTTTANRGSLLVQNDLARVRKNSFLFDYIATYVTCPYTCCRASRCTSG